MAQGPSSLIAVQPLLPESAGRLERRGSFIEADLPDQVQAAVMAMVIQAAPDICIVEGVFLSQIAERLLQAGHRVIVDMHNAESALQEAIDRARYGWRAALVRRRRWALARAAERRLVEQADQVWTCSSGDAAILRAMTDGQTQVNVVPNPVPSWCTAVHTDEPGAKPGLHALFVGHLGYLPNIQAVRRLVTGIFPAIQVVRPDAQLEICGRSPHPKLLKFFPDQPGLTLVADPVDLAPAYTRATVALVPLTEGGGTRLKVLEAMAVGVPVIATAKAVEGLEVVPGQTYLQAETDADFVQATAQLAGDALLYKRLVDAGRAYVQGAHSQSVMDKAVTSALLVNAGEPRQQVGNNGS